MFILSFVHVNVVQVGPPPGGVSEVMTYTPVVFFTPKGIPKEVELGMDSVEYPIAMCRRACGEIGKQCAPTTQQVQLMASMSNQLQFRYSKLPSRTPR